jgi:hypothetical protein
VLIPLGIDMLTFLKQDYPILKALKQVDFDLIITDYMEAETMTAS